jgi:hypothetical protein
MGVLKRGFESGEFVDGCMENMDETHFIMDMENGKTLAFSGDKDIEYADVVSASTGMTMMVKVTSNRIGTPMMVFINDDPIRGVPDKTEGLYFVKYYITVKSNAMCLLRCLLQNSKKRICHDQGVGAMAWRAKSKPRGSQRSKEDYLDG